MFCQLPEEARLLKLASLTMEKINEKKKETKRPEEEEGETTGCGFLRGKRIHIHKRKGEKRGI